MWKEKLSRLGFYLSYLIVRAIVALRYRIDVVGLEEIKRERLPRSGGIVFLPNHPAEIDPVLMEVVLWKRFAPRPLIIEHFYRLKGFRFFLDLAKVLPIPTMDASANRWRAKKVEKQFNHIVDELRMGENFLVYPSGRLKISGQEAIGGASFVHRLIEACPEANIVLVRTTGLWGSMFSRALTGSSPDFSKTVWKGIKILMKNALFFVPKRHVKVEVSLPPQDFPYQGTRLEINKYMENWYNRYPDPGPEPIKLVSYSFWKEELPEVFVPKEPEKTVEQKPVSSAIQRDIFKELSELSQQPSEKIERSMHLSHDLGLDSLDVAQLYVFLDERFEIKNLLPGDLRTVEDVLQAAAGYSKEREVESAPAEMNLTHLWPAEKGRLIPEIPTGKTIQEVFLQSCDRNGRAIAAADHLSGVLSYKRLKMAVLILAEKIRKLPSNEIGVMLPASVGAYIVVLAVLCAKKVPVMLNWTSGVRALDHADALTKMSAVLSSDRFLDRLENGDFGTIENKLLLLENLRAEMGWKDKLKGFFLSYLSTGRLLNRLGLSALNPSSPAVILFTSGTETLPKGVPLSHENILSNQRACMSCVPLHGDDVLYSVLPPFHSFGISPSGLMPLLAGIKACFAPDPNDSHGMAHDIGGWKPTLFFCAPSFIRALFRVSAPDDLRSIRLLVSGAEKTPQELFDYVAKHLPSSRLLEGYGVTECSPVVSFDRPDKPHKGVGIPVPGVVVQIIDPETQRVLARGEEGEICISGPSVFSGYLGGKPDPFIQIEGKRYYRSGDRGMLDVDGGLILAGRMKRFVKIGGEMVSLSGLEEELLTIARDKNWTSPQQDGPPLAISVKEKDSDKPVIVLFTTFSISKDDVNGILKEYGYGRIVKIGEVRKVDHIPLTGTGKTHYRLLDEMTT